MRGPRDAWPPGCVVALSLGMPRGEPRGTRRDGKPPAASASHPEWPPGALGPSCTITRAMETFVQGWGLTIVLCGFIGLVFLAGWWHVHAELAWVRALT